MIDGKPRSNLPTTIKWYGKQLLIYWLEILTPSVGSSHLPILRTIGRNLSTWPFIANSYRALQFVGYLQHFALEIGIELGAGDEFADLL